MKRIFSRAHIATALAASCFLDVGRAQTPSNCAPLSSTLKVSGEMMAIASAAGAPPGATIDLKTLDEAGTEASRSLCSPLKGCGNFSKDRCAAGVKRMLSSIGINMPPGNANTQKAWLEKNFEKMNLGEHGDLCAKAPPGVVCLYKSPHLPQGHIEIKTRAKRYCSDYCSDDSAFSNEKMEWEVVGVYRIKK